MFQARILRDRKDPLAYSMHLCLFFGFMALLVFHALGSVFGGRISSAGYVSTLNPFMFLTNLFGLLLAVGLVLAIVRRVRWKAEIRTAASDVAAIAILLLIAVSGFLLESVKITSDRAFTAMVTQYAGGLSAPEATALKAYWVAEVRTGGGRAGARRTTRRWSRRAGAVHEAVCQSCHTQPPPAFVSYPLSRALAPVAAGLDQAGAVTGPLVAARADVRRRPRATSRSARCSTSSARR